MGIENSSDIEPLGLTQSKLIISGIMTTKDIVPVLPNDRSSLSTVALMAQRLDAAVPAEDEQRANLERTKLALETKAASAVAKTQLQKAQDSLSRTAEYYRYNVDPNAAGAIPGMSQRLIRIMERPADPLEPPKFKNQRAPREAPTEEPPPIMHSPQRKLTIEDQEAWKIPPCVSNWKNQKGYTIPLDKRIAADGRNLQEVQVNDKFAALSESLFTAERAAREEIKYRNELLMHKKRQEEAQREKNLRELAIRAREAKAQQEAIAKKGDHGEDFKFENDRKRELEREMRLERASRRHQEERKGRAPY